MPFKLCRNDISLAIQTVIQNPAEADGGVSKLMHRKADLCISSSAAERVLVSTLKERLSEPFGQAIDFMRLGNKRGALGAMRSMLDAQDAITLLLDSCKQKEILNVESSLLFAREALNLRILSPEIAQKLFNLLLTDAIESADEGALSSISDVQIMMDLDDTTVESTYFEVCSPTIRARLVSLLAPDIEIKEKMSSAVKESLKSFVASLHIPDVVYSTIATEVYSNKLSTSTSGNQIMSANERDELDELARFLDLDENKLSELHLIACAGAYKQSVSEAMGATGVINPEYKIGLEKLGQRLRLRVEDQKKLYVDAIYERFVPMIENIVGEFERAILSKDQYSAKTGKDQGEDLFVQTGGSALGLEAGANLLIEVTNLIDFCDGNNLWTSMENKAGTFTYLISADGIKETNVLEDVYRQFIVSSFQGRSPGSDNRYSLAQTHLSGILGIQEKRRTEIQNDIGKVVIGNYVGSLLRSKGTVEPTDFQNLVNIQQMVEMDEELALQHISDLKVKHAKGLVAQAIREPKLDRTNLEALKAGLDKLDLDIVDDIGVEMHHRVECFIAEVITTIEDGDATASNKGAIEEIQEWWQVPNEEATASFSKAMQDICSTAANQAAIELKSKNELKVIEELEKVARFSQFIAIEIQLNDNIKKQMLQLFITAKGGFHIGAPDALASEGEVQLLADAFGVVV